MRIHQRGYSSRVIAALLALFIAITASCSMPAQAGPEQLSEEQILELRESYPVYDHTPNPLISVSGDAFESSLSLSDTVIHGRIAGPKTDDGEFFYYPVEIIDDTANVYTSGEEISLSDNMIFLDETPSLSEGDEIICAVMINPGGTSRVSFTAKNLFFVSETGYGLSSFDEEPEYTYTGLRADKLLAELETMRVELTN